MSGNKLEDVSDEGQGPETKKKRKYEGSSYSTVDQQAGKAVWLLSPDFNPHIISL